MTPKIFKEKVKISKIFSSDSKCAVIPSQVVKAQEMAVMEISWKYDWSELNPRVILEN